MTYIYYQLIQIVPQRICHNLVDTETTGRALSDLVKEDQAEDHTKNVNQVKDRVELVEKQDKWNFKNKEP